MKLYEYGLVKLFYVLHCGLNLIPICKTLQDEDAKALLDSIKDKSHRRRMNTLLRNDSWVALLWSGSGTELDTAMMMLDK